MLLSIDPISEQFSVVHVTAHFMTSSLFIKFLELLMPLFDRRHNLYLSNTQFRFLSTLLLFAFKKQKQITHFN